MACPAAEAFTVVLVERVRELQALVACHEELHPELKQLRPAHTEEQLVTNVLDAPEKVPGPTVEHAIDTMEEVHRLRRDNARLEVENARCTIDKAVWAREKAMLPSRCGTLKPGCLS
eukprot:GGOE01003334.1.p1 GENE.GGOE01003334.1~~GGOE01003334.1.p1  ORF type:complete len:117 (-),score=20.45 GGOE01003334.1:314-664(-)